MSTEIKATTLLESSPLIMHLVKILSSGSLFTDFSNTSFIMEDDGTITTKITGDNKVVLFRENGTVEIKDQD